MLMQAKRRRRTASLLSAAAAVALASYGATVAMAFDASSPRRFPASSWPPFAIRTSAPAVRTIIASQRRHEATTMVFSSLSVSDAAADSSSSKTTMIGSMSVSEWHKERRRQMLHKYGSQIAPLERQASSQAIGFPLLVLSCTSLLGLSFVSGSLPVAAVVVLAIFPGSMFSLWQLQLLHDVIHGSMFDKGQTKVFGVISRQKLQDWTLFWGSLPCIFGYYLYLKAGHLSHHQNAGKHSLADLFDSDQVDFEDGDVLFVAHRMKVKGDYGPKLPLPGGNELKMSISKSGFHFWEPGQSTRNALVFCTSFLFERILLGINDAVVAVTGFNFFFPHKPAAFHADCATYARVATALRAGLWWAAGWKALLFLYLSESLWSLPPHPACAMFITNHGSSLSSSSTIATQSGQQEEDQCIPTKSTYAGQWYSIFTLGTNFHCEHHDFPTIPFDRLHELRKIAPEFYRTAGSSSLHDDDHPADNLWQIMKTTFAQPEFYACMNAGNLFLMDQPPQQQQQATTASSSSSSPNSSSDTTTTTTITTTTAAKNSQDTVSADAVEEASLL